MAVCASAPEAPRSGCFLCTVIDPTSLDWGLGESVQRRGARASTATVGELQLDDSAACVAV